MRNIFLVACAAVSAQAASITFDHIDFVTYQWSESQTTLNAGVNTPNAKTYKFNEAIPPTATPQDFNIPASTNPTFDGLLGYNTSATALILGAKDSISDGDMSNSINRSVNGGEQVAWIRGTITVKALFDVHGTPGVPINVYTQDALHGVFDTNTNTADAGSATLITTFQAPQEQGYYSHSMNNTPKSGVTGDYQYAYTYTPGDVSHADHAVDPIDISAPQGGHGFSKVSPLESVVDYNSLILYDGTYFDGGTVGVTATLDVWINSNGKSMVSSNDFYHTLQVNLSAVDAPLGAPEPSTFVTAACGALLIGLGTLRRSKHV